MSLHKDALVHQLMSRAQTGYDVSGQPQMLRHTN